jgi:hypothetical protein
VLDLGFTCGSARLVLPSHLVCAGSARSLCFTCSWSAGFPCSWSAVLSLANLDCAPWTLVSTRQRFGLPGPLRIDKAAVWAPWTPSYRQAAVFDPDSVQNGAPSIVSPEHAVCSGWNTYPGLDKGPRARGSHRQAASTRSREREGRIAKQRLRKAAGFKRHQAVKSRHQAVKSRHRQAVKSSANTALHRQAAVPTSSGSRIMCSDGSKSSELAVASKVDPKAVAASKSSELVVSASSGGIEKQRAHLGLVVLRASSWAQLGSTCCEHHRVEKQRAQLRLHVLRASSWAQLGSAGLRWLQLGLQAFS